MEQQTPPCIACGSKNVIWKPKAGTWECQDCESRFSAAPDASTELPGAPLARMVFFSYGHDANKPLVDAFRNDLEKRGHHVWIDYKQIGTWQDWRGRITAGVHESDLAVAFLSRHSTRDPGVCRNELAIALNRFGTVYPVLLESVNEVSPPVTISNLQWQDLSQWMAIRDGRVQGKEWKPWYDERLQELVQLVEGKASEFMGDIQTLREILRPVSFTGDIARHVPDFVGREWVFDAYENWLRSQPASRLLWIKGGPGVGKSAIAAMLVHSHQSAIVGAWFCQNRSLERNDARTALCSLAFQLACRWDDYRSKLQFQLAGAGGKLRDRSEADLFNLLFTEPLTGLIWRDRRLVIVIDALDEATDEHGGNVLLTLLVTQLAALPPWLSFVVTSRPDPGVVAQLEGFSPFEFDAHEPRNRADLQTYLEAALSRRADFQTLREDQRGRIVRTLLDNSEGMILYLREVVRGLEEGVLTLERAGALPGGLKCLYRAAFDYLYGGARRARYAKRVRPYLQLIVAAPGALPRELVRAVLVWDRDTWLAVRTELGSYLIEDSAGCRIFHKTLQEWLTDETSGPYWVDLKEGTHTLGEFLIRCCVGAENGEEVAFRPQVRRWLPELAAQLPLWHEPESLLAVGRQLAGVFLTARADDFLERAVELLNKRKENPALMAQALTERAALLRSEGQFDKAVECVERLIVVQEAYMDTEGSDFAYAVADAAGYFQEGAAPDVQRSEALLRQALAIVRDGPWREGHMEIEFLLRLAPLLESQRKWDDAEEAYQTVREICKKDSDAGFRINVDDRLERIAKARQGIDWRLDRIARLEREHGHDGVAVEEAAISFAETADSALAQTLYTKALAIREGRLGKEALEVARLLEKMLVRAFTEPVQAFALQARAVAICEAACDAASDGESEGDAMLQRLLIGLATLSARAGDLRTAHSAMQRFLQRAEKESDLLRAYAFNDAARAGIDWKEPERAINWLEKAIALHEAVMRKRNHSDRPNSFVADAQVELSRALCESGRWADAEGPARQAMSHFEKWPSKQEMGGCIEWAMAARRLGQSLLRQGKLAEAEPILRDVVDFALRRLRFKPDHEGTTRYLHSVEVELAECLAMMGNAQGADALRPQPPGPGR
jgi:tetratricopeptide (TPR) repeat protein